MTVKFASITLLAALTTAATAQTTHPSTTHHTAKTASKTTAIPHVAGLPKTLFALKYIDIKVGTGPLAEQRKFYTVRYTGWLPNGTKFDSSYDHPGGEPITFPYGAHRVIIGWDTGFEGMHVGGKRRLFVPYQLAYGEPGRPPVIPAKSNLIFDIELVAQSDTPPAPPTPPQPKQPTPPPTSNPTAAPTQQPKPAEPAPEATKPAPDTTAPSSPQPQTPPHPQSH